MSQHDVERRVAYAVKRAQAALNAAMEARLRDLGLGVGQYACLAQIDRRPGISNAGLARAVFVSRQATHQLLAGLRSAGLVEVSGTGRAQRLRLSPRGDALLLDATSVVDEVEEQMLQGLSVAEQTALLDRLLSCAAALEATPSGAGRGPREPSTVTSGARATPGQEV